nr:choline/ethanolamine kinase [Anolis sagrei ordinatus]
MPVRPTLWVMTKGKRPGGLALIRVPAAALKPEETSLRRRVHTSAETRVSRAAPGPALPPPRDWSSSRAAAAGCKGSHPIGSPRGSKPRPLSPQGCAPIAARERRRVSPDWWARAKGGRGRVRAGLPGRDWPAGMESAPGGGDCEGAAAGSACPPSSAPAVPAPTRRQAFLWCREFLAGAWRRLANPEELHIAPVSGGLSNLLYKCSLPERLPNAEGEPRQVLLRVYGAILQVRLLCFLLLHTLH